MSNIATVNTPINMLNRNRNKNKNQNPNRNKNKIQTRRNANNKNTNPNSSGLDATMGNMSNAELNKMLAGNNNITPTSGMNQPMANNSLAAAQPQPNVSATNNLVATDFKITYMTPEGVKMRVEMETPMTMGNTVDRPYIKLGESLLTELKSGKQYLLVMYDINAVGGTFIHMVVLYSSTKMRGVMKVKYFPPTPPAGTGSHKYIFELLEYVENPDKKVEVATYFSSLASERTLKKLEPESPEIATKMAESGDINSFYDKVGVTSSGKIKSMMVSAS